MDRERMRRRVALACREAKTPTGLLACVQEALTRVVPADRWCALTLDPATVLPTGGVHDEGVSAARVPRLLEIEFGGEDANPFWALARSRDSVATLASVTQGRLRSSARYREVFAPDGLGDELRAVFRDEAGAWGALVLLRARDAPPFSSAEIAMVSQASQDICRELRRMLRQGAVPDGAGLRSPGLLVLANEGAPEIVHANDAAIHWLAEIDDGLSGTLPYALASLALTVRTGGRAARARMRTRAGQWLTVHAEPMSDGRTSMILEPSRPYEIAAVLCAAYELTAREAELARLVARGYSNVEIAQCLSISRYTVEDHLKHVYEKLGVTSRAALVSKLFFDQYLPRTLTGKPVGADGWFAER